MPLWFFIVTNSGVAIVIRLDARQDNLKECGVWTWREGLVYDALAAHCRGRGHACALLYLQNNRRGAGPKWEAINHVKPAAVGLQPQNRNSELGAAHVFAGAGKRLAQQHRRTRTKGVTRDDPYVGLSLGSCLIKHDVRGGRGPDGATREFVDTCYRRHSVAAPPRAESITDWEAFGDARVREAIGVRLGTKYKH